MSNPGYESSLALPRSWKKKVRAAVLHAISLARVAVTHGRARASSRGRLRQRVEIDRLQQEVSLLREELRIKDSRMARVPPARRPHYPPIERLAILELRAARGWTAVTTADRFFVTPLTIASWMQRLDEDGPTALVQTREPVNRFPDFVRYLVRRLRVLCPTMGKRRIAEVLCRAGLHLGVTTVGRMLAKPVAPDPVPASASVRRVRALYPNHVWHVDLTTVPTGAGLWTSWLPWALSQRWPFCWWVVVVADHFSRRVMGVTSFKKQPSSVQVRSFLDDAIRQAGCCPQHLITDRGVQFTARAFRRSCRRRDIRQRFGAVGKYGSIAVIERLIRTLKEEGLRGTITPLSKSVFDRELGLFVRWYNQHRPHTSFDAATPDEIYYQRQPATKRPRFEPRSRWPRAALCAGEQAPVQGPCGVRLELSLRFHGKRRHLPIVELRRVA